MRRGRIVKQEQKDSLGEIQKKNTFKKWRKNSVNASASSWTLSVRKNRSGFSSDLREPFTAVGVVDVKHGRVKGGFIL